MRKTNKYMCFCKMVNIELIINVELLVQNKDNILCF